MCVLIMFVIGRSVDRFVNTLRAKIDPGSGRPSPIKTLREIGYRFDMPEE